jgi:hypothetical protein
MGPIKRLVVFDFIVVCSLLVLWDSIVLAGMPGEVCRIIPKAKNDVIVVSLDYSTHKEAGKYLVAGDVEGLRELAYKMKLILPDNGTRVLVIENGVFNSRVRIKEGPFKGMAGWIYTDYLKCP